MTKLVVLEEAHTFPPRTFLLVVWIVTFLFAIFGIIATPGWTVAIYLWSVISVVALWQLWTLRWVQLDNNGIRVQNIFHRARTLRWEEITAFHEQEVQLNKGSYTVLRLSNNGTEGIQRITTITLTNDQVNFTYLREIVRAAVPKSDPQ